MTRKSENLLVCQKCKFELYLNPKPTNAAILENEKGEILLVKRKIPPKEGFWDLPGGFVEVGESAEEAIVREVKEELGISVIDLCYIGSYPGKYEYQNVNYDILGFVFSGKINRKIKTNDEISEVKFFKKDEIPADKIAFWAIRQSIEDFIKIQSTKKNF